MNDFKKPAYKTRIKRLETEIETLQQSRDQAIEAAAKNRLVAEVALTTMLPSLDVSHCDAEDLAAIQDFVTETDHLKEMDEAEPLTLIRSLLESMESPELTYIRAAHNAAGFIRQLQVEQVRLLAVTEILKPHGSASARFRNEQLKAVNAQMGWIVDGLPESSYSDFLQETYFIPQAAIDQEIIRQQELRQGKEPPENDAQNQASEMSGLQGSREGRRDVSVDVPLSEMSREL